MPYTKTEFIKDFNDLIDGKKLSGSTFKGCFEYLAESQNSGARNRKIFG